MRIKSDVANVLANSRVEGMKLYLPEGQLERKLYLDVNKVLSAINGKWNKSAKAHIFPKCPDDLIEMILQTGEYIDDKKKFQFFETPVELAKEMVILANLEDEDTVLEPSAGKGRIAEQIRKNKLVYLECIELNPENSLHLVNEKYVVIGEDFMDYDVDDNNIPDVIIANPPFSKQQDIDHVNKMMDIAKRRVVSIMSASVMFRDNKKTVDFRNRVEALGGTIEALPESSFKESGTKVNTCIVCVDMC